MITNKAENIVKESENCLKDYKGKSDLIIQFGQFTADRILDVCKSLNSKKNKMKKIQKHLMDLFIFTSFNQKKVAEFKRWLNLPDNAVIYIAEKDGNPSGLAIDYKAITELCDKLSIYSEIPLLVDYKADNPTFECSGPRIPNGKTLIQLEGESVFEAILRISTEHYLLNFEIRKMIEGFERKNGSSIVLSPNSESGITRISRINYSASQAKEYRAKLYELYIDKKNKIF